MSAGAAPRAVATTDHEVARARLRSQHLTAPHAPSAAAVVRSLLAVQAENRDQAAWAVGARTAAEGGSTEEIGAQLFLSPATVRNYLSNAISKLDARNRLDAIRIAREAGWM